MSYNGSGTFLINTAGQPVVSGTVISSTAFNALTADLATGLSTAITKDGQTTVTANIPMSTYKFTGLGVGSAATDSANLSQVQSTVTKLLNSVSGADTITATASPTLAAYAAGQMFYFVAAGDNTTSVTLNIDSLGAKAVTRDGATALAASDIKSGEVVVVVYDGTRFQVVSQLNSAGDARFANVSIASSLYVGGVSTFVGNAGFSANVSIASALSVGGVAAITGATTIGGNLTLSGGTANGVLYLNGSKVATSGSALVFDGTNLGIGTASPAQRLQVKTQTNANAAFQNSTSVAGGVKINCFNDAGSASSPFELDGSTLQFNIAAVERMRLDSSGNLGIGTASPVYKLDVNGAANFADNTIHRCGGQPMFARGGASLSYLYAGTSAMVWRNNADSADLMRLDSSGNLGLGVTPPAWESGTQSINVGAGTSLWNPGSGTVTRLITNAYRPTAGNYTYRNNGGATYYEQSGSTHAWYNAGTGTAGNTISFTQAMTLTAAGELLVGTTSSLSRLTVAQDTTYQSYFIGASNINKQFRCGFDTTNNVGKIQSVFVGTGFVNLLLQPEGAEVICGGTTDNGAYNLQCNGTGVWGAGAYVNGSDARLKDNIQSLDSGLDVVKAIRPVTFQYKPEYSKDQSVQPGFIAQELQAAMAGKSYLEGVVQSGPEHLNVAYQNIIPILVKAIQELEAKVAALEAK